MPPKLFAWRRALPKDWATNAYYKTGQTDGLRQPLKSGYDAILCFPKSVWGYETFWRSLGPNRGGMKHFGFSLVQIGGMKHLTVFPGKGGMKHFLKATVRVRNILNFSHRGYKTFHA